MRFFDPATLAALSGREGYHMHALVWVQARNRATGLPESLGLWTGDDVAEFTIGGEVRSYVGVGEALQVPTIVQQAGYVVQMQRVAMGGLSAEAITLLRVYDPRFAPVEIHRAVFDPQSLALVAPPHLMFRGTVDEVTLPTPAKNSTVQAEIVVASSARAGTRTLALRRSDEALRARSPADGFRKYIAISNAVPVWWGERREGQVMSSDGFTPPDGFGFGGSGTTPGVRPGFGGWG